MINWNFSANDYEEKSFQPIPMGDHRLRIKEAAEQTSNSGKQMIWLNLEVSGYNSTIWHYIVFLPDNQKLTNQKLGEFWNSFGIPLGNFDLNSWIGKVGAGKVKHETYNEQISPKIGFFISKEKQSKLEPWKEPGGANNTNINVSVSEPDLPFDV